MFITWVIEQLDEKSSWARLKKAFQFLKALGLLVDNSLEISNISLTPRDLIDTHHIMTLIIEE